MPDNILSEPELNYRKGFIKLYRSVKDHWLYEPRRKRTKLEAWIDLLMRASHSSVGEVIGYDKIEVKRGQILTSQEGLSTDWKWDRSAVRHFLSSLHKEGNLTIETTSKFTMITICNYDIYQDTSPTKQHQNHHQNNTTSTHRKNYKELKTLEDDISNDISVGLPASTPTNEISFEKKCENYIIVFNKLRSSKFQVTDQVRTKLKARLKNYSKEKIMGALAAAIKDEFHIESNFKWLTPTYILREEILERYLNINPDALANHKVLTSTYTPPQTINHDDRL